MTNTPAFLLPFHRSRFTRQDKAELLRWGVGAHAKGWGAALEATQAGLEYAVISLDGAADAGNFIVSPIGTAWELADQQQRHDPLIFPTLRDVLEAVCRTLPSTSNRRAR